MPWDMVFREAARDNEFWAREVDKKVIQFTTAQKSRHDLSDPGYGDLRFAPGAGQASGSTAAPAGAGSEPPIKKRRPNKAERAAARAAAGGGAAPPAAPKGTPKGKGKGKTRDVDRQANGKFLYSEDAKEICWNWNGSKTGCRDPCPQNRAHVCDICRGTQGVPGHRSCEHA